MKRSGRSELDGTQNDRVSQLLGAGTYYVHVNANGSGTHQLQSPLQQHSGHRPRHCNGDAYTAQGRVITARAGSDAADRDGSREPGQQRHTAPRGRPATLAPTGNLHRYNAMVRREPLSDPSVWDACRLSQMNRLIVIGIQVLVLFGLLRQGGAGL